MIKTFSQFIREDFNSSGATQFKLPTPKVKGITSSEVIVFHEHLSPSPFSLKRYVKSFNAPEVSKLMGSISNDYRVFLIGSQSRIRLLCLGWQNRSFNDV